MKPDLDDKQVSKALATVAALDGDYAAAKKELLSDGIVVSENQLRDLCEDTYRQRYMDAAKRVADDIEADTIAHFRRLALRAAEIEGALLERIAAKTADRDVPQALRAVADVKSKSVDKALALQGRAPGQAHQSLSMEQLLGGMADKGLIKINVDIGRELPQSVDGTVEEGEQ